MPDLFDTYVLNRVVDQRVDDTQWLVDTFFPEIANSEEETIMFDKTNERQLITPFVSPLVEGRLIAEAGYETDSLRPAYAKDKRVFDPNKAFRRRPGEKIGGSLTRKPASRRASRLRWTSRSRCSTAASKSWPATCWSMARPRSPAKATRPRS
jgi:hypothetical protein